MAITASTIIETALGKFRVCYHRTDLGESVSFSKGRLDGGQPIVRLHSACLFGEAFSSFHCDCNQQLANALQLIAKSSGVVVYAYQEGRGIGLENKIRAMEIQRQEKCDTVEAFRKLGYEPDIRTYDSQIEALSDLGVSQTIQACTSNPTKKKALADAGFRIIRCFEVEDSSLHELAQKERHVKREQLHYCSC